MTLAAPDSSTIHVAMDLKACKLFEGLSDKETKRIAADMTEAELAISRSTPSAQLPG